MSSRRISISATWRERLHLDFFEYCTGARTRGIRKKATDETEKAALILARRGHGVFKQRVRLIEEHCCIMGVDRIERLILRIGMGGRSWGFKGKRVY